MLIHQQHGFVGGVDHPMFFDGDFVGSRAPDDPGGVIFVDGERFELGGGHLNEAAGCRDCEAAFHEIERSLDPDHVAGGEHSLTFDVHRLGAHAGKVIARRLFGAAALLRIFSEGEH